MFTESKMMIMTPKKKEKIYIYISERIQRKYIVYFAFD